jgi:hypothetical protein
MKKPLLLFLTMYATVNIAQTCEPNTYSMLFNGAASVDLSSDNNLQITDSVTVEAWINASSWAATPAQGSIFCKHSWSQGEQGFVLRAGGTGVLSWNFAGLDPLGNPVSWVEVISGSTLTLNTWYHVAGTFDGNVARIYINGALAGSTLFQGSIVQSTAYAGSIGKLSDSSIGQGRYWNGKIDEVRIWHRFLSQAEITANKSMHIDTATAIGLAGYWRMNEGSGTVVNDISGSGNNGIVNAATWSSTVPFNEVPVTPVIQQTGLQLGTTVTGVTYSWTLSGNPTPLSTTQNFTPSQPGIYILTVTSLAGCSVGSAPFNYTGVGIKEFSNGFSLYPNPADHNLIVQLSSSSSFNYQLSDCAGNIIKDGMVSQSAIINISDLSQGIYIFRIYNEIESSMKKLCIY